MEPVENQEAFLAFASILGGGVVAYEAARSIREGDLLKTEPVAAGERAGVIPVLGGTVMLAMAIREAAKEVGWKPLILGSLGVSGFVVLVRAIRG